MNKSIIPLVLILVVVWGCKPRQSEEDKEAIAKKVQVAERNPVEVMVLRRTVFQKELVSNGKLVALQRSVLKFRTSEVLEYLPVKNGSRVKKGQVIARLRQYTLKQNLDKARLTLDQAKIQMEDILLTMGYDNTRQDKVPSNQLHYARIKSGLATAEISLRQAQFNYDATVLKAPFSGKIANLKYKKYDQVSAGTDFCTLIDDSRLEVVFPVMETELREVQPGKEVSVIPFATNTPVKGRVAEINPAVEENGLVKVRALCSNPGTLLDGMNVRVLVRNAVPGKLVVPKSAVLLRQNLEVLFKYKNGEAYWTYVNIEMENSDSYAVVANKDRGASLQPGDTVIISGNLNLAHGSKVEIR